MLHKDVSLTLSHYHTTCLHRLRKDVAEAGGNLASLFDSLKDVRSLEYDVDMASQKAKRYERQLAQAEVERRQVQQQHAEQLLAQAGGAGGVDRGVLGMQAGSYNMHPAAQMGAGAKVAGSVTSSRAEVDKENAVYCG